GGQVQTQAGQGTPPFQRQIALRHPGPAPKPAQQFGVEASGTEERRLHGHLPALLGEWPVGGDEDVLAVGARRLASCSGDDVEGSPGQVGGQEPEPARILAGSASDDHDWGRKASTSSPRARIMSGSAERISTMPERTARRSGSPAATSPPARIRARVDATSRNGAPSRL